MILLEEAIGLDMKARGKATFACTAATRMNQIRRLVR